MSKALNKAILDRLRGDETVTGRAATAQTTLGTLLADAGSADKPAVRYGAKGSSTAYPSVTFREDAGAEMLRASGVGIVTATVYRFELWETTRDGTTLPTIADCLEQLLDSRRDAPAFTLEGDNEFYDSYLLTGLQGPFHDDIKDCFFGTLTFAFVEARP